MDATLVEQMARSVNPGTEELIEEFPFQSDAETEALLVRAEQGQRIWGATAFKNRTRILSDVAKRLRAGKSEFAFTITQEMGKPIPEAEAEIEKCAWLLSEMRHPVIRLLRKHARSHARTASH